MSATFSAFITTKYIKDNSQILGYVNDDELRTFIRPAQDVHIERVLGTNLYETLMNNILSSSLTTNQDILIRRYIQTALMYWTIYEYIQWSNYKLTNKALSKQFSDNSNPADIGEVNYMKDNISNYAEYYTKRISDYLRDNQNLFPEYLSGSSGLSNKPPMNNSFFGGMYFPKTGTYCYGPNPGNSIDLKW